MKFTALTLLPLALALGAPALATSTEATAALLTPAATPEPKLNNPSVYGFTPGNPVLYSIPATGARPMTFEALGLPQGLSLDPATGQITGRLSAKGDYPLLLIAKNQHGTAEKRIVFKCGEEICLTPPLGWNSWNAYATRVSQDLVLRNARALKRLGLDQYGYTYINVDVGWQGARGGPENAIQPNSKFPDMPGLAAEIHGMGLKVGLYSAPWITTYGNYIGGTSDDPRGNWTRIEGGFDAYAVNHRIGKYSFAAQDARQMAAWGIDYLKYDWFPNDVPSTREMSLALKSTGRDIVFSLSNNAPLALASELSKWANVWRTTGDLIDRWERADNWYEHPVTEVGFCQDQWGPFQRPGHFNDPDMLVVGVVAWEADPRPSDLTPTEQYSHMSLWAMLSGPLLLGCDLEKMDAFTLNLITNREVIAINQDALCKPARRVATYGPVDVYVKELEDGGFALGVFNRGKTSETVAVKLHEFYLGDTYLTRDVWRQTDLGEKKREFPSTVDGHGVMLYRLTPKRT
jgi:alpha-galactosidase